MVSVGVPEPLEAGVRRHGFQGQDILIELVRKSPTPTGLAIGESDLAFIQSLCTEVGIGYIFSMDARLNAGWPEPQRQG